ncbi:MAG: DUF937 domain-containing protein [Planctomycetota bacterium]
MSELLDSLRSHLTSDRIDALSESLGSDPDVTRNAIAAAIPTLLGAVTRSAGDAAGSEQLHRALDRDHDGSILEHLGELFGDGRPEMGNNAITGRTTAGGAILDHLLGSRKSRVEDGVSRASGLSAGQASKLLVMLAPLLMGAVGRRQREQQLSPEGLHDMLRGESHQVQQDAGVSGSIVSRMLDQDGDGDFDLMDIMHFGMGRLFNRS